MTATLWPIFVFVAAGLAGAALHELTHWFSAWLVGRPAWISWSRMDTIWEAPEHGPTVRDRLIGVAPLAIGLGVGVYLYRYGIVMPLWAWFGWGIYTLNGSLSDLTLPEVSQETESPASNA